MPWPTPQEYNEAVQNPAVCFSDEELREAKVTLNELGLPKSSSGAFASVYQLTCGTKKYALRCFLHRVKDQQLRYERLSKSILKDKLDSTVSFRFIEQGIRVGENFYPTLLMEWVQGINFEQCIRETRKSPEKVRLVQDHFREMVRQLQAAGFAHGDLQHGNIIVTGEGLRLVDYDGMFVPALASLHSNELGHRNYQHPGRTREHFGPYLDNFSAWVIDTSLTCLIEDPELYSRFHAWDECMLFKQADFKHPDNSEIFFALETHQSAVVRSASRKLRTLLQCLPFNVPALNDDVPEADQHPMITAAIVAAKAAREAAEQRAASEKAAAEKAAAEKAAADAARRNQPLPSWLEGATVEPPPRREQPATPEMVSQSQATVAAERVEQLSAMIAKAQAHSKLEDQIAAALVQRGEDIAPELRECEVEMVFSRPFNYAKSNAVFRLASSTRPNIALKILYADEPDQEQRWRMIGGKIDTLGDSAKRYFVKTLVIPDAVRVGRKSYLGITMPWYQNAVQLGDYLMANAPDFDYTVLTNFRKMIISLHGAGVAHGTLNPTNILVNANKDLILVDYDNFYCVDMHHMGASKNNADNGWRHPVAHPSDYGLFLDCWTAWALDTMLMCWCQDRSLWSRYKYNQGSMFFNRSDFSMPERSPVFTELLSSPQYELKVRAEWLIAAMQMKPQDVPSLPLDGASPLAVV